MTTLEEYEIPPQPQVEAAPGLERCELLPCPSVRLDDLLKQRGII